MVLFAGGRTGRFRDGRRDGLVCLQLEARANERVSYLVFAMTR